MTEESFDVAWHPTECDSPGFLPGRESLREPDRVNKHTGYVLSAGTESRVMMRTEVRFREMK